MDDWDSIDWDVKVEAIIKNKQEAVPDQSRDSSEPATFVHSENDGNYFEINEQKKKLNESALKARSSNKSIKKNDAFIQPYSSKDLSRICGFTKSTIAFDNLIYETFGQFEKFILTHQKDLTHEAIVELLQVDVSLLEVPFHAHHNLLLSEISKCKIFWLQLIEFMKEFLSQKHKDLKFLLSVDMNGFFDNVEQLLHNILVNNLFSTTMEKILEEIISVLGSFEGSKWSRPERLEILHIEYLKNLNIHRIYNVSFTSFTCVKVNQAALLSF